LDRRRGSDPSLLILISLAGGPKHGHAMLLDIERFAGQRLGPGTLYGAIERLEQDALITPVNSGERRTPYRLTPSGQEYLAERIGQMRHLAKVAHARGCA
jgi:DNA-binding PadR family transcriptional regulator